MGATGMGPDPRLGEWRIDLDGDRDRRWDVC